MRSTRWSIAARLTTWHALTAFILVAGAVWLQYRALVRDLAAEDDQLLRETIAAVQHDVGGEGATGRTSTLPLAAWRQGSGAAAPSLRILDSACHPIDVRTDRPLPPPSCVGIEGRRLYLRSWIASGNVEWRVATQRFTAAGPYLEVLLDRETDAAVLSRFRRQSYIVLAVALAASIALGYLIARRGLAPISQLGRQIATIDAKSLDRSLVIHGAPAEVRELAESFDVMRIRLQAAFAALSNYSAEMAHELRTPLHVLRQQLEIALGRARSVDEYRDVMSSSLEEIERLRRMAEDFLFLARAEDPRAGVIRETLDVSIELRSVADFMDAIADEKSVALIVDCVDDGTVRADRTLLRRALVNLVSNALAHTRAGGTVRLSAHTAVHLVQLFVEDTGCGISPEALPYVFDRYYRAAGALRDDTGGAGLGLAIVNGIARLHGGSAHVWSEVGHGTRITLELPCL